MKELIYFLYLIASIVLLTHILVYSADLGTKNKKECLFFMDPKALLWQISISTPLVIDGNSLLTKPVKWCENKNTLKHLNNVSAFFSLQMCLKNLSSSQEMGICATNLTPPWGNESRLSDEDREQI